jgi:ribose transport system substrate-binding protein
MKKYIKLCTTFVILAFSTMSFAQISIGYVTKSATNAGWMMINQGAADAASEEGVNLITVGPSFQGDLSSQLEVFENLVNQKASAIAIAPVDSAGIAPAVEDVTSFVATDNLAVAKVQGAVAATLVANGDTIIYVTGNQAQTTGQERRDGFLSAFASARPDSKVLIVPTEWNSAQAQSGVEAVLNANSDVKMVANAWDGGTMGAKAALENLGYKAGQVKLVGFDGAGDAIEAMEAGWVHADTAQMLYQMGYQGVKAAVAAVQGKSVNSRIDTGFFLVTPATVQAYKDMVGM